MCIYYNNSAVSMWTIILLPHGVPVHTKDKLKDKIFEKESP